MKYQKKKTQMLKKMTQKALWGIQMPRRGTKSDWEKIKTENQNTKTQPRGN
jgi:hypothetical protein